MPPPGDNSTKPAPAPEPRAILAALPDLYFLLDAEGYILDYNQSHAEMLYRPPEEFLGRRMQDVLPDVAERFARAISSLAGNRSVVAVEYALPIGSHQRWFEGRLVRILGNRILVIVRDQTERKGYESALRESERHYRELAEHNRRLLLEVDHRVKNNLTGLLSLLGLTRRRTSDIDAFAKAMESRLRGMAHIHQILSDNSWQQVDLRSLADSLLRTMGDLGRYRVPVSLNGPPVSLPPDQAMPLTMILVEWFTNSCKYGAHSAAAQWDISWELADPDGQVRLRWRESGGPPIPQPVVPALGSELVQSFATRELRGQCALSYPPDGVDHVLTFAVRPRGE